MGEGGCRFGDERLAAGQHRHRRVEEHRRWLFQGFLGGAQEIGDSLEALERGVSQSAGLVFGPNEKRVQRLEHVRQPKRRVARVGSFGIEPVVGNSDIIEEGGTIDFVLEIRDLHVFHRFGQ